MLSSPLTVMQGPPGTGKSQVIAGVALNAGLHEKSVLISAHTHKAMDAVEERIGKMKDKFGEFPFVRCNNQNGSSSQSTTGVISDLMRQKSVLPESVKMQHMQEKAAMLALCQKREQTEVELNQLYGELYTFAEMHIKAAEILSKAPWVGQVSMPISGDISTWREAFEHFEKHQWQTWGYNLLHPFTTQQLVNWTGQMAKYAGGSGLHWFETVTPEKSRRLLEGIDQANSYQQVQIVLRQSAPLVPVRNTKIESNVVAMAKLTQDIKDRLPAFVRLDLEVSTAQARAARDELDILRGVLRDAMYRESDESTLRLGTKANVDRFRELYKAYPAWGVTALSVGRYVPFTPGIFDLVMIDESSQMNIAQAIPLLFRAQRAAIIGDPQQLSLTDAQDIALRRHWGLTREADTRFSYYQKSLYDLAASSPQAVQVSLNETFRSSGPIAAYCSKYFYGNRLEVATDESRLKTPDGFPTGIDWINVEGAISEGPGGKSCWSEAECKEVVRLVKAILINSKFDGTVGVVTPFNPQAVRIYDAVAQEIPASRLKDADFVSATAHAFQGGERDVMIMSLCGGDDMPPGCMTFLRKDSSIFNVAVSRARSTLLLVGNKSWAANCGVDYIAGLTEDWNHYREGKRTEWYPYESPWEKKLAEALIAKGFNPIPQYQVGARRLDLALVDEKDSLIRLDIEVDGETYHRNSDGSRKIEDTWRDISLQSMGWPTQRFWVFELRADMDGCVKRIEEKWAELHQSTKVEESPSSTPTSTGSTASVDPSVGARWARKLSEALLIQQGIVSTPEYRVGERSFDLVLIDKDDPTIRLAVDIGGTMPSIRVGDHDVPLLKKGWVILRLYVYELEDNFDGCVDLLAEKWAQLQQDRKKA